MFSERPDRLFLGTGILALWICVFQDLVNVKTGIRGVSCMVLMLIPITLGSRLFNGLNVEGLQRKLFVLLIVLSGGVFNQQVYSS